MKKTLLLALNMVFLQLVAQDTSAVKPDTVKAWALGGTGGLNFSQVSLSNWSAGGENSLSLTSLLNLFGNYKKDLMSWDNSADFAYGFLKPGSSPFKKSDDKMELNSKWGRKTADSSHWYYTLLLNFKSQFSRGYNPENDSVENSDFLAPGYLLLSTGIDYKPKDYLSIFISPVSGKMTIVNNQRLADAGAFGVTGALFDTAGTKTAPGKKVRNQFGALVSIKFKKDIMKNTNFSLKADLFSDYLKHPENIDINLDLLLAMKVNSHLVASVTATLIYDDDILLPIYRDVNGTLTQVGAGPRTQFKEVLSIGLSFKF